MKTTVARTRRNDNVREIESSISTHAQCTIGEFVRRERRTVDAGGVLCKWIISNLLAPDVVPEIGGEKLAVAVASTASATDTHTTARAVGHTVVVAVSMTPSTHYYDTHEEEHRDEQTKGQCNNEGDPKVLRPGVCCGGRFHRLGFQF